MRAAIFFLLPLLGSCRNLVSSEVADVKRDAAFDGAVSVCYTYTTVYLAQVTDTDAGSGKVFFWGRSTEFCVSSQYRAIPSWR